MQCNVLKFDGGLIGLNQSFISFFRCKMCSFQLQKSFLHLIDFNLNQNEKKRIDSLFKEDPMIG